MIKAFVLIQTEIGAVGKVAEALSVTQGVETADEITGPYDIIARVCAVDLVTLGESVTNAIQRIDGVTRTLTCPATRNIAIPGDS